MEITSYENACEVLNLNAVDELPFKGENLTERQRRTNAYNKLMIINEAMHTDVAGPRYYFPYFWDTTDSPSSPGFSYVDYAYWGASARVGARLQYATRGWLLKPVKLILRFIAKRWQRLSNANRHGITHKLFGPRCKNGAVF